MRLIATFFFYSAAIFAQSAEVTGIVVNSVTGQPMAGVHVSVFQITFSRESITPYGAVSDSAGRLRFPPVAAGTYFYMGEMNGYVSVVKNPTGIPLPSLIVKAGKKIEDLRVEMAPQSIVAGRVLDEFGNPVVGARISVEPPNRNDPASSIPRTGTEKTDGRGEFRWFTGPGKWVVQVTPPSQSRMGKQEIRDGVKVADFPPVFYPGVVERDRAKVVEIAAGQIADGLEVRLTRQAGISIDGTVSGMPPGMEFGQVILRCGKDAKSQMSSYYQTFRKDGKFQFSGMAPAVCEVSASTFPAATRVLTPPFQRKFDADTKLDLTLVEGSELRGRVIWIGDAGGEGKTISLVGKPGAGPVKIAKDGSFRFDKVFPGKATVEVAGLAGTSYVAGVEIDGAKAVYEELNVAGDVSRANVTVTVSDRGSQVSGHFVDASGERIASVGGAAFLLRSKDEELNARNVVQANVEGTYEFKNVRPGKYWLCGFDAARFGSIAPMDDMKKIALGKAVEVELKAGESMVRDIAVPVREAADAKH